MTRAVGSRPDIHTQYRRRPGALRAEKKPTSSTRRDGRDRRVWRAAAQTPQITLETRHALRRRRRRRGQLEGHSVCGPADRTVAVARAAARGSLEAVSVRRRPIATTACSCRFQAMPRRSGRRPRRTASTRTSGDPPERGRDCPCSSGSTAAASSMAARRRLSIPGRICPTRRPCLQLQLPRRTLRHLRPPQLTSRMAMADCWATTATWTRSPP